MEKTPHTTSDPPAPSAAASDVEGDAPTENGAPECCSNCGAERAGDYCQNCGQEFVGRLTLWRFWHEFAVRYLKLEEGLWLTFRQMFTDPGGVARRYVEGKRRRYTNPLGYLLLATAVALLCYAVTKQYQTEHLTDSFMQTFEQDEQARENLAKIYDLQDRENVAHAVAEEMVDGLGKIYQFLALLMCVPMVLLLRLFFPGPKRGGYNLAETTVFAVYTIGHGAMLVNVVGLFVMLLEINLVVNAVLIVLIFCAICGYGALNFYGGGAGTVALAVLSTVLSYAFYSACTLVFMIGDMFWHAAM